MTGIDVTVFRGWPIEQGHQLGAHAGWVQQRERNRGVAEVPEGKVHAAGIQTGSEVQRIKNERFPDLPAGVEQLQSRLLIEAHDARIRVDEGGQASKEGLDVRVHEFARRRARRLGIAQQLARGLQRAAPCGGYRQDHEELARFTGGEFDVAIERAGRALATGFALGGHTEDCA